MNYNFDVIIRSNKESTVSLLKKQVSTYYSIDAIVVEQVPFEKALYESYKIGSKQTSDYIVMVDGDVLITRDSIPQLIAEMEQIPKAFALEGIVLDGILLNYRRGGVKVYRKHLLEEASELIPKYGISKRPETETQISMTKKGYSSEKVDIVVGIHDYFQRSEDMFRKGIIHAQKWRHRVDILIPSWKKLAKQNIAYEAFLSGVEVGLKTEWKGLNAKSLKEFCPEGYKIEDEVIKNLNTDIATDIILKAPKYTNGGWTDQFFLIKNYCGIILSAKFLFSKIKNRFKK